MIKLGIVGTRGLSFAKAIKDLEDRIKVAACCDLSEDALRRAKETFGEDVKTYRIYEDMLSGADLDAVLISTPMQHHVPQAIEALGAGLHVMCEVTAAVSMDELWWLIEAVEKSGRIYMYSENYCDMPDVVLVRELVRHGMFGEVYYGEGEYTHDCTTIRNPWWDGRPSWRSHWQMGTRGAFYPTH